MKQHYIFRKVFAFAFIVIVLFTVSVQETHYLFSDHHAKDEHCENHLHADSKHTQCTVCKFNIPGFTDEGAVYEAWSPVFLTSNYFCFYQSPQTHSKFSFTALRGPPVLA